MEEGKLFRQLRKDRGLTLVQVADELNSRAFISKFENGASHISLHRLERLLDNINVTIEEFYYLRGQMDGEKNYENLLYRPNYMTSRFLEQMDQILTINKGAYKDNASLEKALFELKKIRPQLSGDVRWQRFLLLYMDILQEIYENNLQAKKAENVDMVDINEWMTRFRQMTRPVVSYLLMVDNWGVFEVLLFRYFQFTFPLETSHLLLNTAVSRTKKEKGLAFMRDMQMDLIFSSFATFINFQKFEWAKEVLQLAEELLENQGDLLNSTQLLGYQGWYLIASGNQTKGMEKCHQAISIFRILKQPLLVTLWEDAVKMIQQNVEQPGSHLIFR